MSAIRATAPQIQVVNAEGDVDEVARSFFGFVWKAL